MERQPLPPGTRKVESTEPQSEFLNSAREIILNGYIYQASEHDRGGRDEKRYHVSKHPRMVALRAERLADIFQLSEESRAIARMAVAWHDTVLEYDAPDFRDVTSRITRHRGAREGDLSGAEGNEAKSARLLVQAMERANRLAGKELFTEEQMAVATWAIDATYPKPSYGLFSTYSFFEQALEQNPELKKSIERLERQGVTDGPLFEQPHLEDALEAGKKVPREVLIVALSDVMGVGTISPQEFFREGDSEMQEVYANLSRPDVLMRIIEGETEHDRADRTQVKDACFGWLKSQPGFAAWQALRFEKIVYLLKQSNDLSEDEEAGLRRQFDHFPENIQAAGDRVEHLDALYQSSLASSGERQAIAELLKEMGYPVAP